MAKKKYENVIDEGIGFICQKLDGSYFGDCNKTPKTWTKNIFNALVRGYSDEFNFLNNFHDSRTIKVEIQTKETIKILS